MKKYNKIVASFTKTINKLEALSGACGKRISDIDNAINTLGIEKADQALEGKAASNTARKLKDLIEG